MSDENPDNTQQNVSTENESRLGALDGLIGSSFLESLNGNKNEVEGKEEKKVEGEEISEENKNVTNDQPTGIKEESPEGQDATSAEGDEEEKAPSAEDDEEKEESKEPLVIENDLFGRQAIGESQDLDLKDADAVVDFVKGRLGIDDIKKLPEVTNKWRKDSERLIEVEGNYNQVAEFMKSLPDQLQNALTLAASGDNWMEAFDKHPQLDYQKNIADYTKRELIDTVFPGKFSEADWENYRSDDEDYTQLKARMDDNYEIAKGKFKESQAAIKEFRAKSEQERQQQAEARQRSITRSENHFTQTFPNAKSDVVSSLKSEISDGGVERLFFNSDGSVKEDALVNFAMAKSGLGIINQYMELAKTMGANEHVQKEILNKKGGVQTSGGSGSSGKVRTDKTPEQAAQEIVKQKVGGLALSPETPTFH